MIKLAACGQDVLGLPKDVRIDEDSNFLLSGGDSLKALRLCEDVLAAAGAASADLLEVVLDGTFSDVLSHVTRAAQRTASENGPPSPGGQVKRRSDVPPAAPTKRERKRSAVAEETWAVTVLRRAGEVAGIRIPETLVPDGAAKHDGSSADLLDLSLSWSSDTGRCVDASPVLLVRYGTGQSPHEGRPMAVIGSHSHRIQALDLISGSLVWERVLGGRIEASAAVSHCGSLVVVGPFLRLTLDCLKPAGDCASSAASRLVPPRLLRQLCVFLVRLIWRHAVDFQDGGCGKEQPSSGSSHRSGPGGVPRWQRLRPEPTGEHSWHDAHQVAMRCAIYVRRHVDW